MSSGVAADEETPSRLARLVPAVDWLRHYDRRWLAKDVLGGLAAGAVVIPQAMAYATIAHLPVEVGLYTCLVPMVVYAFLGGSRTLSVSTTSTVAVLTGSTLVAAGVAASAADPARQLASLTVMVGVILMAARLLHLGSLVDNISDATLAGIKIGVGLTVAAGQLPKLFGVEGDPSATTFFPELRGLIDDLGDTSWTTVALSAVTLAVLLGVRRFVPRVPGPLVAVVLGILSVAVLSLDDHGVALIAKVPSGLPTPVVPAVDHLADMLGGAFAVAMMCLLETAAVAASVRRPTEPPIDNDQELAANAVSCLAGGFFRAMPSAGGFSQTAMNQQAGAKTQLSELVTAALAVACALFLGGVLSDLPEATLACMVLVAVLGLVSISDLVRFWRLDHLDFWVAVVTAVSGVFLGLLPAVLIGVVLTLFLVLHELNRVGVVEMQPTPDGTDLRPAGESTVPVAGLLVLRFNGPLYTANVRGANRRLLDAVDRAAPDRLVVDVTAVGAITVTIVDHFADLRRELDRRGVILWIAAMSPQALATARKTPGWDEFDARDRIFPTALAAVRAHPTRPLPGRAPTGEL